MDTFVTIVHEYFDDIAESQGMHYVDQQWFHNQADLRIISARTITPFVACFVLTKSEERA